MVYVVRVAVIADFAAFRFFQHDGFIGLAQREDQHGHERFAQAERLPHLFRRGNCRS